MKRKERLLLIDTCGESAGVALSIGEELLINKDLERLAPSAEIVSAVRKMLQQVNWSLAELDAIGVVNGPGSFTGMRTGLAAAKGMCEATRLPLVAVSRLEVLADAAPLQDGFVALDAGRGKVYVRDRTIGREWLCSISDFATLAKESQSISASGGKELRVQTVGSGDKKGKSIVLAEDRLEGCFAGCKTMLYPLRAGDTLGVVLRRLHEREVDVAQDLLLIDANYVREESDIYRKQSEREKPAHVESAR